MTATITKEAAAWKLPDLDTVYHCEELGPMTLGQMLDGVDPDLIPSDQTMYEDLLCASAGREREDTDDGHAPGRPRLTRMPPAARMAGPTRATRHPCPWRGPTLDVLRLRGLCARPGGR